MGFGVKVFRSFSTWNGGRSNVDGCPGLSAVERISALQSSLKIMIEGFASKFSVGGGGGC